MSRFTQAAWWALSATSVFGLVWYVSPDQTSTTKLVRPAQAWVLPPVPDRVDVSALASKVGNSPMWGATAASSAIGVEKVEDPRWAISGSYIANGIGTAVIRFASQRPELLVRNGDALPGGEVVLAVEADRVCVAIGRKRECRPVIPTKVLGF